MSKKTSPTEIRLGITLYWHSTLVPIQTTYTVTNKFNVTCLQLLTNLFYKEKLFFSTIGIKTFSLSNVKIVIEYFQPLSRYSDSDLLQRGKFGRHKKRKSLNPIVVNELSLNFYTYPVLFTASVERKTLTNFLKCSRFPFVKLMKVWKKKVLLNITKLPASEVVKQKSRFHGFINKTLSRIKHADADLKQLKDPKLNKRTSLVVCKIIELRLKNFLENLLVRLFNTFQIKVDLINLGFLYSQRFQQRGVKNVFDLIRRQIVSEVLTKKDGHNIFWQVTGLIICGCYFISSHLLLMWLTLKLSGLRKFDLYFTQTKLIYLFFNIIKNVFFLLNTIAGVHIEISGKINGKMRASTKKLSVGNMITKHSFNVDFDYCSLEAYTYTGTLNCKLWLLKI